jgi:hypothetical protein
MFFENLELKLKMYNFGSQPGDFLLFCHFVEIGG